jgi:LPXTG-motif cell wall-anchored protein
VVLLAPTVSSAAAYAQTAETATVTVVKDARPNSPRNFHFTTDVLHSNEHGLDNFTLDDDSDPERSNTQAYTGVVPGTYWVTEHPEDGWRLSDINCSGGQVSTDLPSRKVTITVAAGDTVTCTFVNVQSMPEPEPTPEPSPSPSPSPTVTAPSQPLQQGTQTQPEVSGDILATAAQPAAAPANAVLPAQLPRTGSAGIGALAGSGAALIAAGAVLLARGRRRRPADRTDS